ncbi:hypothetical protein [Flavobacterium chungangensis]|uniref:Uncharacterized protein n=1 Tax=Flavobacterium chungangensis TaxID=2708132 RepID=A0ABV8ZCE0_9FLAO
MALYRRSFKGVSISLEQPSITYRAEGGSIFKLNLPFTCTYIIYEEIISTTGIFEACTEEETLIPPTDIVLTIDNFDGNCLYYTTSGDVRKGVKIKILDSVSEDYTSVSSPYCGISGLTQTTYFQLQSLDNPAIYSGIYIYYPPVTPNVKPTKILLSKSPQFIIYDKQIDYNYITISLYMWQGDFDDPPLMPNYSFKVDKISDVSYLNISQYLQDFFDSKPNETYFDDAPSDFGELINLKYTLFAHNSEFIVDQMNSDVMLASLGYGNFQDFANPVLILADGGGISIDSTLISIDSTLFTIDEVGDGLLFDQKSKYHKPNTHVFSGYIDLTSGNTAEIFTRQLTDDFKLSCTRKYEGKEVLFRNKSGFFDTFSFTRASSESVKFTQNTTPRLNKTPYSYHISDHNSVVSKTGNKIYTLNTDNLNEYSGEVLTELFYSDCYFLIDAENKTFIPLHLQDTDFSPKTDAVDRAKQQYTFKFIESNEFVQKIR